MKTNNTVLFHFCINLWDETGNTLLFHKIVKIRRVNERTAKDYLISFYPRPYFIELETITK